MKPPQGLKPIVLLLLKRIARTDICTDTTCSSEYLGHAYVWLYTVAPMAGDTMVQPMASLHCHPFQPTSKQQGPLQAGPDTPIHRTISLVFHAASQVKCSRLIDVASRALPIGCGRSLTFRILKSSYS